MPGTPRAARGEYQHQRRVTCSAHALQHVQAIHAGDAQVQQHGVMGLLAQDAQCFYAVGAGGHDEVAMRQRPAQCARHVVVVFHQQQFQGQPLRIDGTGYCAPKGEPTRLKAD